MYSVFNVANYILYHYYHDKKTVINQYKLQKLLYYCYIRFLKDHEKELFYEKILAWYVGPIIREIYQAYSMYETTAIPADTITEADIAIINDTNKAIINDVIEEYDKYSANELTNMIKKQSVYKNVYQLHRENIITSDDIRLFFKEE